MVLMMVGLSEGLLPVDSRSLSPGNASDADMLSNVDRGRYGDDTITSLCLQALGFLTPRNSFWIVKARPLKKTEQKTGIKR